MEQKEIDALGAAIRYAAKTPEDFNRELAAIQRKADQEFLDRAYLAVLPVVAACAKRGLMYSEICFEAASAAHEALKHRPMVEDGE